MIDAPGLFALERHHHNLESRAARAEAFDDEFRDTLCAAIFVGDARALDWLQTIAEAHRAAWEMKRREKLTAATLYPTKRT